MNSQGKARAELMDNLKSALVAYNSLHLRHSIRVVAALPKLGDRDRRAGGRGRDLDCVLSTPRGQVSTGLT